MSVRRLSVVLLLFFIVLAISQPTPAASPPQPTYGAAIVDGNIGEWDLSSDLFASMYRAGNAERKVESKAYLRYDYDTEKLYVLVLAESGIAAQAKDWESAAWGAIESIGNKGFSGHSPDFKWVNLSPDGLTAEGYEASFTLDPRTGNDTSPPPLYHLILHLEVMDDGTEQSSATEKFPDSGVDLEIPAYTHPDHASIALETYLSQDGQTYHRGDFLPGPSLKEGQTAYIKYLVRNNGNTPLSNVHVDGIVVSPLAPGESKETTPVTFQAVHGQQSSTMTASGIAGGMTYSHADRSFYLGATANMEVCKYVSVDDGVTWEDANNSTGPHALVGGQVYFRYVVSNPGDTPLKDIALVDSIHAIAGTCVPGSLDAGKWFECVTGPFPVRPGQQTDTATGNGTHDSSACSDSNSAYYFGDHPCIDILKTFAWLSGDGTKVGDVVTFTFTVINKGNVALTDVKVHDDKFGDIVLGSTTLAPGASTTGSATLPVTQDLLNIGLHTDTARATGKATTGSIVTEVSDETTQTVTFTKAASIDIVKSYAWTTGNGSKPNDVVTFTFTVTNTGNEVLHPVTVTDVPLGTIPIVPSNLAPGQTGVGTKTLTLTQALLDAGSHIDTATASGTAPDGTIATDTAGQTVTFITAPSLDVSKTFAWTKGIGSQVNDEVTFNFTVTNTGNVTLSSVGATDNKLGQIVTGVTLAPGASTSAAKVLPITQALIDLGSHVDTVTTTGTPPVGSSVTDTDTQTVVLVAKGCIDVLKSFAWTKGDGSQVDDEATFTFKVTNVGNVTLTDVALSDDKISPITPIPTTLAPGASATGTGKLTVTQAMLDAGTHTDTATVTAKTPAGTPVNDTATQTLKFINVVAIDIIKTYEWTNGDGSQVGHEVTFTFTVTNKGNTVLNSVGVTDNPLGSITIVPSTLAPGQSGVGTKILPVTQEMLDDGYHIDTATATGTSPGGKTVTDTVAQRICLIRMPGTDIVKYISVDGGPWLDGNCLPAPCVRQDDSVRWMYWIKNIGNVTLDDLALGDSELGPIPPDAAVLTPEQTTDPEQPGTWTEGLYTNLATIRAVASDGRKVHDMDLARYFGAKPEIDIDKTFKWTKGDGSHVGDEVTYSYLVTNKGNVTLTNVRVHDDKLGDITLPKTVLEPDESTTGTAKLIVTQDHLDHVCRQTNTATAIGTPPCGSDVDDEDSAEIEFIQRPHVTITKYVSVDGGQTWHDANVPPGPYVVEDMPVRWWYEIKNDGNVTLINLKLVDDKLGPISIPPILPPGETTSAYKDGTAVSGQYTNTATVTGDTHCDGHTSGNDPANYSGSGPSILIVKSIGLSRNGPWYNANENCKLKIAPGINIYYQYVITNVGDVGLTDITLTDDVFGPGSNPQFNPGDIPDLDPDETFTYVYGSVVSARGCHTNTGTTTGKAPDNSTVGDDDPASYFGGDVPPVYQAYPGDSNNTDRHSAGYAGRGDDVITAVPGLLVIIPQDEGEPPWANYVGAFQDEVDYTLKKVSLVKATPSIIQCADVFPSHTVMQEGTPNIRLRWPLMYEVPGTVWTLTIQYGTSVPYDDDGSGPHPAGYYHTDEWMWQVDVTLESMQLLLALFHEVPFARDEVPLISDEVLYPILQAKIAAVKAAYEDHNLVAAGLLLGEFEMEVMDACIATSPARPIPTGPGTGIAETEENPACCKLLADAEYVGFKLNILQPTK